MRVESAKRRDDLPSLVHLALRELQLAPENVTAEGAAADVVRRVLGSLAQLAGGIAELRNLHGTGHGKPASHETLEERHARLAVGAAATLGSFLFETHKARDHEE